MDIIGFSGPMGSGKSTAIDFIRQLTGRPVINVKFAQPLYDIQEFIYGRISSVYSRPPTFIKDRKLLQWIGTEWGRGEISESLWIDLWEAQARAVNARQSNAIIVCDDVRFDNEAAQLHNQGAHIIRLICDKANERINTNGGLPKHASEAGIADNYVDCVVANNGTLTDFEEAIDKALSQLGF